jgi:hypothetical protein
MQKILDEEARRVAVPVEPRVTRPVHREVFMAVGAVIGWQVSAWAAGFMDGRAELLGSVSRRALIAGGA